ncbi:MULTISPECIES: 2'-5' RNA ligase family protein [unclassified Nocardia]|uniref:2'-5' RNA ligase family protein n=1 Tax=unclassified Nocardia TaxID=2637762 RepID=UPI001CE41485|nr:MULTISPECIES: hypothetical protein [unclassified Nocardia]
MRPQQFRFGDKEWPGGEGVLQVYAPVDVTVNRELAELIGRCRTAMDGAPVTPVDDAFLHVTLDVVAGRVAREVPPAERKELVAALGRQLAGVPAYRGTAGSAMAYVSGVVVDISPAGPLIEIQRAVRGVIRNLCGDEACTWQQSKPHIGTHYCFSATDSDPWQRRLRDIDPNHVPLRIDTVALVDVRPDNTTKRLTWTPVAPLIRLAG